MHGSDLLLLAAIMFVGFVCQWLSWRLKVPSILFLLLTGVAVGPVAGVLDPDALFGELLTPFVSVAVAIILFEGSLTLEIAGIRGHGKTVRNLVTVGVLITWACATLAAHLLLQWEWMLAALFGAIVTVSGPTVIMPLMRTIHPNKALSNIFRWEGILIDPLGAILAVLVFNFIIIQQSAEDTNQLFVIFGLLLAAGVGLGLAAGQIFGVALRRHWLPDFLREYGALALVVAIFALAESVAKESGLLAVTIMGIRLANMKGVEMGDILDFKESLTLILVAGLFIVLAARVPLDGLIALGSSAVVVLLLLQFVAGPLRAFVSASGSSLNFRERLFLGWIFPRGIVAAAVASLFALRLEAENFPGADLLVPMVFFIIVGTVLIQSLSGKLVARLLRVADPAPHGVLIVGANEAALTYAKALHDCGRRVVVASNDWSGIRKARMAGFPVYFGSPVSGYAEDRLDLVGIGHLLGMSQRPGLSELACVRFSYEFGRENVYSLPSTSETSHDKHRITGQTVGRLLFSGDYSIDDLIGLSLDGASVKTTEITDTFSFKEYVAKYPDRVVLFVAEKDGRLRFPVAGVELTANNGAKVCAFERGNRDTPTEATVERQASDADP